MRYPPIPNVLLVEQIREEMLSYLQENEAIIGEFAERLLGWKHSGYLG